VKELLCIRNAAACFRVGTRPPYRLRKEGRTAGLLVPWPWEGEEALSADSSGKGMAQGPSKMKQDLS
jgi:hypothetical protein